MAKKPVLTAKEAAAMIPDGATIMCGGFLACGQARAIVKELVKLGTKDLTLIANDMGRATGPKGEEFFGIAELIHNHQVKRVIATHVGMTPEVGQQNTEGTLEVNLLPQGTLAECVRAGGAGLGGVLTPVGIDTLVEESPFCLGRQTIDGKDYLLMKPVHADFALLGAYKCDEFGNCWYKGTMRNFNVVMASVRLTPGDPEQIKNTMHDIISRRRDKQPLEYPSASIIASSASLSSREMSMTPFWLNRKPTQPIAPRLPPFLSK